ncbi:hypothetical protein AB0K16_55055 [Nonomuraea jabiensis]|uniref:hypothetical protein n=1 Tax=Nonomuraea jabiensis TaxID=882448 RepID=UPI00341B9254
MKSFADRGDQDRGFVADGEFIVPGSDSAVAFEPVDAALDGMAPLVHLGAEGGGPWVGSRSAEQVAELTVGLARVLPPYEGG